MGFLDAFKGAFGSSDVDKHLDEDAHEDYVELDTETNDVKSKIIVKPFIIEEFDNIKDIVDSLREGNTIALVNIKPLKDKDLVELKRTISKLKKTCDAIDGEVAGFGEDYIVAVPSFARIHRTKSTHDVEDQKPSESQQPPQQPPAEQ